MLRVSKSEYLWSIWLCSTSLQVKVYNTYETLDKVKCETNVIQNAWLF